METVNNFSEIPMIASIISQNYFDEIREAARNGTIHAHSLIADWSIEFNNKYKHVTEWEDFCEKNQLSDWEECIYEFTKQKIKALTLQKAEV